MNHVVGLRSQTTLSLCLLAQAYQLFSLVVIHDPYRRFTYVCHTYYLALTCLYLVNRKVITLRYHPRALLHFATLSSSLLYSEL